jgi:curved DNA-binding protein CbpA
MSGSAAEIEAPDLYSILGVKRDAKATEIKKAYIAIVKIKHPDVLKSSKNDKTKQAGEEEFKKITHAYDILKDVRKRREYDGLLFSDNIGRSNVNHNNRTATKTRQRWKPPNSNEDARNSKSNSNEYEGASWADSQFTEQELKNRYARFQKDAKSRAENSAWWREEKLAAERNIREFTEKQNMKNARKAMRDSDVLRRSGFLSRTGVAWQDAAVAGISLAIVVGAGAYINHKIANRTREEHFDKYTSK